MENINVKNKVVVYS